MNKLFSPQPLWAPQGMLLLRVVAGLLMAYHGLEVFKPHVIKGYAEWEVIKKLPAPLMMAYLGKGLELVTGVLLTLGLFTRIAALFMAINMFFICFKIGGGKFYYEDQHPFIFGMLALVFFFCGSGIAALDNQLFKPKLQS